MNRSRAVIEFWMDFDVQILNGSSTYDQDRNVRSLKHAIMQEATSGVANRDGMGGGELLIY